MMAGSLRRGRVVGLVLLAFWSCGPASAADWHAACKGYAGLASKVMEARQAGVAMSSVTDVFSSADASKQAQMTQLVIAAYSQPRYETDTMQQSAVGDFTDDAFLACAKGSIDK